MMKSPSLQNSCMKPIAFLIWRFLTEKSSNDVNVLHKSKPKRLPMDHPWKQATNDTGLYLNFWHSDVIFSIDEVQLVTDNLHNNLCSFLLCCDFLIECMYGIKPNVDTSFTQITQIMQTQTCSPNNTSLLYQ